MTSPADIPALRALPPHVLQEITAASRPVRFPAGTVIRRPGDPAHHVVLLLSGTIDADPWTGQWTGPALVDKAAVLAGGPQPSGLVAATTVTARLLGADRFHALLAEHRSLREHVLRRLARDVTAGLARTADRPAVAHVAAWLHEHAEPGRVVWPGSQERLARLLGLSRVTVNRALGRLARDGAVRLTTRGIVVADHARLAVLSRLERRR